jgi:ubiquinone biosynthesis accessory factor UbiJ
MLCYTRIRFAATGHGEHGAFQMLNQTGAAVINHLLEQSGWALARLVRYHGRTVRFQVAPFTFSYTIQPDGRLAEAAADASADVTCVVPPSLLPRLATQDEKAYNDIESSGDSALLNEIFFLSRNLKWDAAEDLSHFTGDIAAERIVQAARAGHQQVRESALNLSQALSEYWTEERPLISKPEHLNDFALEVDRLRDDVARLEQRINRLTDKKK